MAGWKFRLYEYRMIGDNRYERYLGGSQTFKRAVEQLANHLEVHRIISYHIEEIDPERRLPDFLENQKQITKELRRIGFTRKLNEATNE